MKTIDLRRSTAADAARHPAGLAARLLGRGQPLSRPDGRETLAETGARLAGCRWRAGDDAAEVVPRPHRRAARSRIDDIAAPSPPRRMPANLDLAALKASGLAEEVPSANPAADGRAT
jgi:hypothetical protein